MKNNEMIGQLGEDRIAVALKSIPDGHLLRNLYIPCGRGTIEIDALLATKKGLFVIECKAWTGSIRGSARLNDWSVKIWPGAKPEKRYSPIKQNATHLYALSRYLRLPKNKKPHSVIVFTSDQAELKKVPENTGDYTILKGAHALQKFIERRIRVRRDLFTEQELNAIVERLKSATPKPTNKLKKAHVNQVKRAQSKRLAEKERRRKARRKNARKKRQNSVSKRAVILLGLLNLFHWFLA